MERTGAEVRVTGATGVPPLVVGEAGVGARTLIWVQRYDVQPAVPLELWKKPPYDPAVRDGAVCMDGTLGAK